MKYFLVGIVAFVLVFGKTQADSECVEKAAEACAARFEGVDEDDMDCGLATEAAKCVGSISTQCNDISEEEIIAVYFVSGMIEGAAAVLCEEQDDYDRFNKRGRKRGYKRDLKKAVKRALKRHIF